MFIFLYLNKVLFKIHHTFKRFIKIKVIVLTQTSKESVILLVLLSNLNYISTTQIFKNTHCLILK